jgi:hypothetical protein
VATSIVEYVPAGDVAQPLQGGPDPGLVAEVVLVGEGEVGGVGAESGAALAGLPVVEEAFAVEAVRRAHKCTPAVVGGRARPPPLVYVPLAAAAPAG